MIRLVSPLVRLKERMESGDEQMRRGEDIDEAAALCRRLREMVSNGEITAEEARKRYKKAFPPSREPRSEEE